MATQQDQFSIAAYKGVGHYGQAVYAIRRNGALIGELLFDGGRYKNAGGPAWVATLFQTNGCHAVFHGTRRDYQPALDALKASRYHLQHAAENRPEFALKRPLTYRDGQLLNGTESMIPKPKSVTVRLYPDTHCELRPTIRFDDQGRFEVHGNRYHLRVMGGYAQVIDASGILALKLGEGVEQDGQWAFNCKYDPAFQITVPDPQSGAVAVVYFMVGTKVAAA